jgi:hypothetical protein
MIIRENAAYAYYPVQSRVQGLIRGTGRIRYVRGFLLVKPRRGAELGSSFCDPERVSLCNLLGKTGLVG